VASTCDTRAYLSRGLLLGGEFQIKAGKTRKLNQKTYMTQQTLNVRAEWVMQIKTPTPPSHIQLGIAGSGAVMASPTGAVGEDISLWPNLAGGSKGGEAGRALASQSAAPLATLKGHTSPVTALRFGNLTTSEGTERMASASDDAVLVWVLPGGHCVRVDDPPEGAGGPGLGCVGIYAYESARTG
jgi:hypothetical protein